MKGVGVAALVAVLALSVVALPLAGASPWEHGPANTSAVFISTNNATANQVVVYERASDGMLTWIGHYLTGGTGTGAGLADSGALALTSDNHWLLAVDAGSNQVSVFRVGSAYGAPTLTLTDLASSGGVLPVSVTTSGNVVYVLNDGSSVTRGNIAGFFLMGGQLQPISGSTRSLGTSGPTGSAQISFNPTGQFLVVTEKTTDRLAVYTVNKLGVASRPTTYPSSGTEPYGFDFAGNRDLVVSEAATGSVSSYSYGRTTGLQVISGDVSDTQAAPCWVVITGNGRTAFISNTASDSISSFAVGPTGSLTLIQAAAAGTGAGPAYSAIAGGTHFLYVYDGGVGEIEAFQIGAHGSLTWLQTVGGLPIGSEGLVAA
jgi:6-phosphogluconolactonase